MFLTGHIFWFDLKGNKVCSRKPRKNSQVAGKHPAVKITTFRIEGYSLKLPYVIEFTRFVGLYLVPPPLESVMTFPLIGAQAK